MLDDAASRAVLVSIHPRFASAISSGTKTVELRRKFPEVQPGTVLVIYVTLPVGAVVGVAIIERVDRGPPAELWEAIEFAAGVSRDEFDRYFKGSDVACAVRLRCYSPLPRAVRLAELSSVELKAPQSFRYLQLPAAQVTVPTCASLPAGTGATSICPQCHSDLRGGDRRERKPLHGGPSGAALAPRAE
jgi:predicted transcriptional regulator